MLEIIVITIEVLNSTIIRILELVWAGSAVHVKVNKKKIISTKTEHLCRIGSKVFLIIDSPHYLLSLFIKKTSYLLLYMNQPLNLVKQIN